MAFLRDTFEGEMWHGVPLSELNKLAQTIYYGKSVGVDKNDFLVFNYSSHSRQMSFHAQCELDEAGRLVRLPHNYYPGQSWDAADDFVEEANRKFTFR